MPQLPLHHLKELRLERDDLEAFDPIAVEFRRFRRHEIIRAQGDEVADVYLLIDGWVASRIESAAGSQQIVKIHLPGEMLGSPSLALAQAAESLIGLTRGTVAVIPSASFGELFMRSSRIAAAMFLAAQRERIFLMDRLMSIGRTSAAQRLAAFLLSIHERLSKIARASKPRFELPLSQQELADVLGITTVHANRTLAHLEQTGLIGRSGRWITIADASGLRKFGCMPERHFRRAPPWFEAQEGQLEQAVS